MLSVRGCKLGAIVFLQFGTLGLFPRTKGTSGPEKKMVIKENFLENSKCNEMLLEKCCFLKT